MNEYNKLMRAFLFVLNAFRFVHFLTRNMRLYVCVKGFGWGDV